jgi:hypothetical protein
LLTTLSDRPAKVFESLVACFGIGLAATYILSALGRAIKLTFVGGILCVGIGCLVLGGLVFGVLSDALQGIQTMVVMNAGTGLWVGSLAGWRIETALPHPDHPTTTSVTPPS